MRLIKRMGSLGGLMKMIPGMNKIDDGMLKQGEQQLKKIEAMIGSMTPNAPSPNCWRPSPPVVVASPPVAVYQAADVDKVLADFQKMRGFMQQMTQGVGMPGMPGMGGLPGMGGMACGMGGGMPGMGMPGMGNAGRRRPTGAARAVVRRQQAGQEEAGIRGQHSCKTWWLFGGDFGPRRIPFTRSATMIKLRLKRFGKKREASFRLVACNSTSRRDGRPLQELGFYNPRTKETRLDAEGDSSTSWPACSAHRCRALVARKGWLDRKNHPPRRDRRRKASRLPSAKSREAGRQGSRRGQGCC